MNTLTRVRHASFVWGTIVLMSAPSLIPAQSRKEAALIQTVMETRQVPGASIAVIDRHKKQWAAGFGLRRAGGEPVNAETVFQAASISKPTTAMAVMLLAQRKVLALDDGVNAALQSWKIPASTAGDVETVTLRRLLSHSAGMSVHGFAGYAEGQRVPDFRNVLNGTPPAHSAAIVIQQPPGDGFKYSGGGYCIVQQLLEDVGKRPFEEIMTNLVLSPCGMTHSTFDQPLKSPLNANRASGHGRDGNPIPGDVHVYPEMAAAGLWTTASDYAELLLAIDRAFTNARPAVFPQAAVKEMMVPQNEKFGLGWMLGSYEGKPTIWHTGINAGFYCYAWLCPELGKGLVIFTNSDNGSPLVDDLISPLRSGELR